MRCDVTSWEDQLKVFKTAIECSPSGNIDFVLVNAGIIGADSVFANDSTYQIL